MSRKRLTTSSAAVLVAVTTAVIMAFGGAGAAFAGTTYQSHSTGMTTPSKGDATRTLTLAKPSGLEAGDLMLAQITFEKGSDAGTNAQLMSAGWTLVVRTNRTTDIGQAIFYRVATEVEPASYTFPFRQAVKAAGAILRYQGVDTADPIVAAAGAAGDSSTLTAPSVSAEPDSRLISLFGFKKKSTTLSVPSGMTGRYNFQNPQDVTISAADEVRGSAGPTGPRVSTPSPRNSDKWVAQNVLLRNGNTPPAYASPTDPQTADEGENKSFQLGSFTDPDPHASWAVTVDWGDGSSEDTFNSTGAGPLARDHTYADEGTYTIDVTVDDGFDSDDGSFDVTVSNVAPSVTAADDQSSDEGQDKSFDLGSFTDPGVDDGPWAVTVDWGDGSTSDSFDADPAGSLGSRNHTYADNGLFTVTVDVTDGDGASHSDSFEVTVSNVAPSVTAADDQSSDEGQDKSFDLGSFTDPGVDDGPWAVTVDWGDGSTSDSFDADPAGSLGSRNHTYADNGLFTVTVDVTDGDGASHSDSFEVTVSNVAPSVTAATDQTAVQGTAKSFALGSFSDVGTLDTPWAASVNWGDGSASDAFSVPTQGSLGNLSHTYSTAGAKTVTVTVTDKDGSAHAQTFQVTVAASSTTLYLHNNPTPPTGNTSSQANLPMNPTTPGASTLFNYATNYDSGSTVTGRFIDKISTTDAPTTTDLQKFQTWRWPGVGSASSGLPSNLVINGTVDLKIWAKMKASGKDIDFRAFLRSCSSTGGSCSTVGTLDMARSSLSNTSFQELTVSGSVSSVTVPAGNTLQLRLVMLEGGNADPAYFAYDTATFPARLILP